jgi:hypothetical protein
MRYARRLGLPATAGSDMHDVHDLRSSGAFGVYLNEKLNSIDDFVKAIRENSIADISVNRGRCNWYGDEKVIIPVDVRDENDKSTGKSWKDCI